MKDIYAAYVKPFLWTALTLVLTAAVLKQLKPYLPAAVAKWIPF